MKHILELTAKYKMGMQHLAVPVAVLGRNILRVEKVPEEVPEYMDGSLTIVQTSIGERLYVSQSYEEVINNWHESLEHSL